MSKITTNRFPARHGAQWKGEEYHKLVLGIEQGLTLAQLAERHERTLDEVKAPQAGSSDSSYTSLLIISVK